MVHFFLEHEIKIELEPNEMLYPKWIDDRTKMD